MTLVAVLAVALAPAPKIYVVVAGLPDETALSNVWIYATRDRHLTASDHEARLKLVDPEEDEMQYPNCSSARVEPYALDPDGPIDNPFEYDEEPGIA